MEWKRLARSKVLWSSASLEYRAKEVLGYMSISYMPDEWAVKNFVRYYVQTNCLYCVLQIMFIRDLSLLVFFRHFQVTPYLHHLSVSLIGCDQETISTIHAALLSSDCSLHKLTLSVEEYSLDIMLFLRQHPELRVLELSDWATDNEYAAR